MCSISLTVMFKLLCYVWVGSMYIYEVSESYNMIEVHRDLLESM